MTFAMAGAPAPGSDRIPVELFQILKDDAVESAALNMQYALYMQYAGSQQRTNKAQRQQKEGNSKDQRKQIK